MSREQTVPTEQQRVIKALVSGGRVEIGLGAGWWTEEHTQFGIPFPPTRERFGMLEEQLEIVHRLFTEDRFTFEGRHYTLDAAEFLPKPVQRPRPPIVLGGTKVGPWMQRLIGTWADEFNTVGGTPDQVRQRFERARDGTTASGREAGSLVTSLMTWCFVASTQDEYLATLERARSQDPTAGSFDAYRADVEADCIVGTPERAAERLSEYAAAGVERIMLNHTLYDEPEMLELLASEVFPKVEG